MKKEVKLFNDNFSVMLTDFPNLKFLTFEEEGVSPKVETTEFKGTDGVLMGPTSFGPFNLIINLSYLGQDEDDLKLMKQKLRSLLFQREPYMVWHSDMPGKKYVVYCEEDGNSGLTSRFSTFAVKFVVIKGYSESLKDTDEFSLSSGDWQFEGGLLSDDEIKYNHSSSEFKIYNGSSDKIDPQKRHKLNILINIDAPNGFKMINKENGNQFEYKKPIKKNKQLSLIGVHPYIDNKRVGKDTNWQWITLEKGFNDIEIIGENLGQVETKWIFPFIYR